MGRQINFYIDKTLESQFIQYIISLEFTILSHDFINRKLIQLSEEDAINKQFGGLYLYKDEYGVIFKSDAFRLDDLRSPVIQFSKTTKDQEEKIITWGRIWMESRYYDDSGCVATKDSRLTSDYNLLVKWLKKRVPYQEVKKGDYLLKEYVTDRLLEESAGEYRFM